MPGKLATRGIAGEGLLPVVAGLECLSVGMAGAGETACPSVDACLAVGNNGRAPGRSVERPHLEDSGDTQLGQSCQTHSVSCENDRPPILGFAEPGH